MKLIQFSPDSGENDALPSLPAVQSQARRLDYGAVHISELVNPVILRCAALRLRMGGRQHGEDHADDL